MQTNEQAIEKSPIWISAPLAHGCLDYVNNVYQKFLFLVAFYFDSLIA